MNIKTIPIAALISLSLLSFSVVAHDPSLHKKSNEKPNCAAIKDMDHTMMDADDPVMLAMMKRCQTESSNQESQSHHQGVSNEAPETDTSDCTPEHAKMGHCTFADDTTDESNDHENH